MTLAASQMKMTAVEAFCAATLNGAAALGLDRDRGAILPRMRAHLNLYRPSAREPAGLSTIEEIVIAGLRPTATVLGRAVVGDV